MKIPTCEFEYPFTTHATAPGEPCVGGTICLMQKTLNTVISRFFSGPRAGLTLTGLCLGMILGSPMAAAQDSAAAATPELTTSPAKWYLVKGRKVNVRCKPSLTQSYVVGQLDLDAPLLVKSQKEGWASIKTTGPAFKNMHGLLRGDERIRIDGDKAITLASVPLMAPNVPAENDPDRSWARLTSLNTDTTLPIHSTFEDNGEKWLLVGLPSTATLYVNTSFLREATPEETARFQAFDTKVATNTPAETTSETPAAIETTEETVVASTETEETVEVIVVENVDETTAEAVVVAAEETTPEAVTEEAQEEVENTVTIQQVEETWQAFKKEPRPDAELETLQLLYMAIAENEEESSRARQLAELRIRQLEIRKEIQERLRRIEAMDRRNEVEQTRIRDAQVAIEARAAYDVVGRINASQVYDGKRLPQLYRIQSATGGRTLGYVRPSEKMDLNSMIGRLVGIVGDKNYDAGYRLMIVTPKRIDILTTTKED